MFRVFLGLVEETSVGPFLLRNAKRSWEGGVPVWRDYVDKLEAFDPTLSSIMLCSITTRKFLVCGHGSSGWGLGGWACRATSHFFLALMTSVFQWEGLGARL